VKPEDVPAELVIKATTASSLHFEQCDEGDNWQDCDACRRAYDRAHYALAAALPEHERTVREQLAKSIEAERDKVNQAEGATLRDEHVIGGVINGLNTALRLVRGETP
jgi:hypothetical protein